MAEIKGLKDLLAQFESIKNLDMSQALLAGAITLQRYSMENAPVDTGYLRASHTSTTNENGAQMEVNTEYAYYVEYGTKKRQAHPFVRPAIDEHSNEILAAIKADLEKQIGGITGG
jgi:HK97 gp10 family phage protein